MTDIKRLLLMLTMLGTVLFGTTSCLTDVIDNDRDDIQSEQESFFIRLSVPSGNITMRSTATIVQPEAGETDVRSLHLFFFDEHGDYAGMVTKGDLDLDPASPCILDSGDLLEVDLTQPEAHNLNNSTDYRILAIANLGAYVGDMNDLVERVKLSTLEAIRNEVANASGDTGIQNNTLLMSAEVEKSAIEHFITVPLIRAVARLDVIVNPRLNTETNPNNVMITDAKVVNVAHETGIWNPARNDRSAHVNLPMLNSVATDSLLGRLYAFENEVVAVSQNDTQTTAVIIGISRDNGATTYHRVNVAVPTRGQILRRNNVYQIVINHVLADGQPTWDAAYAHPRATLDVSINDVNVDDQGLIFIDGDNVLAIPTGLFVFPPEGIDEQIFNIFTHTPDPANVRLGVSAITLDPGLSAILSGNELRLSATPATELRRGHITLSFGNIRATINIEQASMYQEYLMVSVGMNDIPAFWDVASDPNANPNGGIMADAVQVTSSSQWTARVYNDFFEFVSVASNGDITSLGDAVSGQSGETFRLQANDANPHGDMRHGFVIVSLMSNPSMNRVLILRQRGTSTMNVTNPADPTMDMTDPIVRFTSDGQLADGSINTFRINVFDGGYDDGTGTPPPPEYWIVERIVGAAGNFEVTPAIRVNAASGSDLTITALTPNYSGSTRIATVHLQSVNNPAVGRVIRVEQASHTLSLNYSPLVNVPVRGGTSGAVTVNASTNWNVAIETISGTSTTGDGRRLVQHEAVLVDQNGNPLDLSQAFTNDTQLRVRFPKVFYPNRQIPISATVTVSIGDPTVEGGGITQTFNVTQQTLTPRPFNAVGIGGGWGSLAAGTGIEGADHNRMWVRILRDLPGYTFMGNRGSGQFSNPDVAGATYVHISNDHIHHATFNWTNVNNWWNSDERGVIKIVMDEQYAAARARMNDLIRPFGWPEVRGANPRVAVIATEHADRKVHQFVMGTATASEGSPGLITIGTVTFIEFDGNSTTIRMDELHETAVAITVTPVRPTEPTDILVARFVICPATGVIWSGEGRQFDSNLEDTPYVHGRRDLLNNIMFYISNAARFGSHFMDLFIEDGHPRSQPAPWDSHWDGSGTGGTDNRGVPTR